MKDIKDEIIRIRSLFSEERLYGNLINEACDDESEAKDLLLDKGYKVFKIEACKTPSENLKCVKDILGANGIQYNEFDHKTVNKCVITIDGNHSTKKRKLHYMFVNDKNEYAFRMHDEENIGIIDGIDIESADYRGSFKCESGKLYFTGELRQYKERGDGNWTKYTDSEWKSITNLELDLTKIKQ